MPERLVFRVRNPGDIHPSHTVTATGEGTGFDMTCDCLAGLHRALLCPHMAAVIREDAELVMEGASRFEEIRRRSAGSRVADRDNGYWQDHQETRK